MARRHKAAVPPSRFDVALWRRAEQNNGIQSLREMVASVGLAPREQIAVVTIISDEDRPIEYLSLFVPHPQRHLQVGKIGVLYIEDERGPFVLACWPTAHPSIYHLQGTAPTTDPRWRSVERWLAKAGPNLVPCLLNHSDFVDIGASLSEHGDVEVTRLAARKRSDLSSLNRGWRERPGSLRPSPHEAIAHAEDEGASVRTLSLHVSGVIDLHLRRLAGATFYGGDFDLFERVVLARLATGASRRRALLSDRERRVAVPPPKPISVVLPGAVLTDAEATGEVLHELESRTSLAVAVLHRNPYLHVVVTDNTDGSNFDVFVTSPTSIEVLPGFRSSVGALTRLTQQLGERFEALEIRETEASGRVSLDDLLIDG